MCVCPQVCLYSSFSATVQKIMSKKVVAVLTIRPGQIDSSSSFSIFQINQFPNLRSFLRHEYNLYIAVTHIK